MPAPYAAVLLIFAWLFPLAAYAPDAVFRKEAAEPVRIFFAGDMMFDRSVRVAMLEHGDDYIFSCMSELLKQPDFVVANLEGPITSYDSESVGSAVGGAGNTTFTFPTTTANLLRRNNISLVNLGNNHILNFGSEGAAETLRWLHAEGVSYFGDPLAENETDRVARLDVKGIPFSFVNWSDWTGGDEADVASQIRSERAAGRMVIVYTHWGDEYVAPSERVGNLAHAFIDAGAEIVIGSHPHVVLEHELYHDKHIYYSLGNFVFDQYFNEEVRNGLMLDIVFDSRGVKTIEEIGVYLERDRRTCLKTSAESVENI